MESEAKRSHHVFHMVLGLAIVAGVVVWAVVSGGGEKAGTFLDLGWMIWMVGILVGGLWISFGPATVLRAFRAVFSHNRELDRESCSIYLSVFVRAYQLAWGGGLAGIVIGVILMFQNLDDPSRVGPGMAMALIPVVYGLFLAEFLFAPLQQVLANRAIRGGLDLPVPVGPYRSVVGIGVSVAFSILMLVLVQVLTHSG